MRWHDEDVYSLAGSPSMEVMIGEEKYMEWPAAVGTGLGGCGPAWRTVHSMRHATGKQEAKAGWWALLGQCWLAKGWDHPVQWL